MLSFDNHDLKTGDVLRLELETGVVDAWEIEAFYYGGLGQESVIEVTKLDAKPPEVVLDVAELGKEVTMYVPANIIHMAVHRGLLTVFRPGEVDAGRN